MNISYTNLYSWTWKCSNFRTNLKYCQINVTLYFILFLDFVGVMLSVWHCNVLMGETILFITTGFSYTEIAFEKKSKQY
jgi:hypothetical protein